MGGMNRKARQAQTGKAAWHLKTTANRPALRGRPRILYLIPLTPALYSCSISFIAIPVAANYTVVNHRLRVEYIARSPDSIKFVALPHCPKNISRLRSILNSSGDRRSTNAFLDWTRTHSHSSSSKSLPVTRVIILDSNPRSVRLRREKRRDFHTHEAIPRQPQNFLLSPVSQVIANYLGKETLLCTSSEALALWSHEQGINRCFRTLDSEYTPH